MLLILGFILMMLFGYSMVTAVSGKFPWEEKLALSFGFGLGFLTLVMFYLSRVNIPLTPLNIISVLIFFIVFINKFFLKGKNLFSPVDINFRKLGILALGLVFLMLTLFLFNKIRILVNPKAMAIPALLMTLIILGSIIVKRRRLAIYLMVILIFFSFLGVLAMGIYWPVNEWDSMALYDFIGKLFSWQKSVSFPPTFPNLGYFVSYPFLTPIAHTFLYIFGGNNPKFIYPLFYGSLLLIFFSFIKKEAGLTVSLFFTLLLGSSYFLLDQAVISYANLPCAFYQVTGALFLYQFLKTKNKENLIIAGMSLGLSAWTRPAVEPFFLACFLVLLIFNFSWKKIYALILFPLLYFSIGYPWQIYIKYGLKKTVYDTDWIVSGVHNAAVYYPWQLFNFNALFEVLKRLIIILSDFKLYGAGGLLLFLFLILNIKNYKKEKEILLLIFLNLLFWIVSIFGFGVMASFNFGWEIILQDSMTRVFLGIYPLLIFYVAKTSLIREIFE